MAELILAFMALISLNGQIKNTHGQCVVGRAVEFFSYLQL